MLRDRLAAELAAMRVQGNLREAFRARFDSRSVRPINAGQQLLNRKDQEEVNHAGDDQEVDAGS